MTWMIIRLVLCLAFIGAVLVFAGRVAQKRGIGGATGVIEVVARQRMGRASSVSVVRVAGRVTRSERRRTGRTGCAPRRDGRGACSG